MFVAKAGVIVTAAALALGLTVASGASSSTTGGIDFSTNAGQNLRASLLAEDLNTSVALQTNFGGLRITSTGIEISVVGSATSSELSSVAAAAQISHAGVLLAGADTSAPVPVAYRSVANSLSSLTALTARLDTDNASLTAVGVAMSSWGPDIADNKVLVHLQNYTVAAAKQLETTHGSAIEVTIDLHRSVDSIVLRHAPSDDKYDNTL